MPTGDLCTLTDAVSYLGDNTIQATSLTALSYIISAVSAWTSELIGTLIRWITGQPRLREIASRAAGRALAPNAS